MHKLSTQGTRKPSIQAKSARPLIIIYAPVEYECLAASMPDFTSQSATPSCVYFAGAKVLATFSADQCFPIVDQKH